MTPQEQDGHENSLVFTLKAMGSHAFGVNCVPSQKNDVKS